MVESFSMPSFCVDVYTYFRRPGDELPVNGHSPSWLLFPDTGRENQKRGRPAPPVFSALLSSHGGDLSGVPRAMDNANQSESSATTETNDRPKARVNSLNTRP